MQTLPVLPKTTRSYSPTLIRITWSDVPQHTPGPYPQFTESDSPGHEPIWKVPERCLCTHTPTVITALELTSESHYVWRELLTCYDSSQSKNKLIFIRIQLLDIPIQWLHKTLHCLTSDVEKLQSFILKVQKWKCHTLSQIPVGKHFQSAEHRAKTLVLITEAMFLNLFPH